jgi:rhamnulokinase
MKLLAFDYGASSGRAILGQFDGSRLTLDEIHRFSNDPVFVSDSLYWDILRLFYEMKQGILKAAAHSGKDISSIGIDTWGVDIGLLDKDGKLLGNPLHYRDSNTEGMMEKVFRIVPDHEVYERTGIQFQPFNTLYQLFSLQSANSHLLKNASTMLFIPDLLRYFLTGEKTCEYTIASTSQMINADKGSWDTELLDKLNIPTDILPEIINPGNITGKLTEKLSRELIVGQIPVVAVAEHDTGSAVISVPSLDETSAYLSSGTWSLLGVESPKPVINKMTFGTNYTNEGGYNRSTRLLKNIMGLWIFQECKRAWDKEGTPMSFGELTDLAYSARPFAAFIDPDDNSFYSPGGMPDKIRSYCEKTGQPVPVSKAEIVRCIMESLALKYRMAVEELEQIVGYKISSIHIVGGGSKNTILSQFTANATNKRIIAGPVEATAIGNILVQLIAMKEIKNLNEGRELVRNSFSLKEYLPQENWDEAYSRFLNIIDLTRMSF